MTTDAEVRWDRITSEFPKPHTVYWNALLPDGSRLTVSRIYDEDGRWVPHSWRWRVWAPPKRLPDGRFVGMASDPLAEGFTRSPEAGKRLALQAVGRS